MHRHSRHFGGWVGTDQGRLVAVTSLRQEWGLQEEMSSGNWQAAEKQQCALTGCAWECAVCDGQRQWAVLQQAPQGSLYAPCTSAPSQHQEGGQCMSIVRTRSTGRPVECYKVAVTGLCYTAHTLCCVSCQGAPPFPRTQTTGEQAHQKAWLGPCCLLAHLLVCLVAELQCQRLGRLHPLQTRAQAGRRCRFEGRPGGTPRQMLQG
jgi:hypothetical protein